MDDITSDEFERIIGALKANAEALGRINIDRGGSGGTNKALPSADEFNKQLVAINKHLSSASTAIAALAGGAQSLSRGFKTLLGGIIGGAIVADIIEAGEHLYKTYQHLSEAGATFGGSISDMVKAAADANLPLDEFATMIKRNSVAAAQLSDRFGSGATSLGALNKSVQGNLKQFGYFGMSLSEISDITGDYADTMRLLNTASYKNKQAMTDQISQFAIDIGEWSAATGADRKRLEESVNETLRNADVIAAQLGPQQQKSLEKVTTGLTATLGDGGKDISAGLSQMMAAANSGLDASVTDFAKMITKAGAGDLLPAFSDLSDKMRRGVATNADTLNFMARYQKFFKDNSRNIEVLAKSGSAEAAQFLEMSKQIGAVNEQELAQKMKYADAQGALTKIFSGLEANLTTVSTSFIKNFMEIFGVFDDPTKVTEEQKKSLAKFQTMFNGLSVFAGKVGTILGEVVTKLIDSGVIQKFEDGVVYALTAIDNNMPQIEKTVKGITEIVGKIFDGLGWIHKRILGWFGDEKASPIGHGVAVLGTAFAGLAALMAGKKLFGALLDLPGMIFKSILRSPRTVDIKAGIVNVNGGKGGGLDLGGGGSGGGGAAKKAEEEEAVKDAEHAAEKKGILGSIKSGLGSLFKGNKFTRALGSLGEKYLASKSGSLINGAANVGHSVVSSYGGMAANMVKGGLGEIGNFFSGAARKAISYTGMAGNIAKGGIKSIGKWIGERALKAIGKLFGPTIGALVAASDAAPQIFEAYGYYESGKLSTKDFASILINTLGPAAVGALAGYGGEVVGGAAGSLVAPGAGTLVGAIGGSIAVGYVAGKVNKHLFNEDSVTKKLQEARDKEATDVPASTTDFNTIAKQNKVRASAISDVLAQAMGHRDDDAIKALTPENLRASMPAVPNDPTKLQTQFQEALDKEPALEKKVKDTADDPQKVAEHTRLLKELNDNIMKLVAIQVQANAQSLNLQKRQIAATNQQGQH